jgi:primosomal protein N'
LNFPFGLPVSKEKAEVGDTVVIHFGAKHGSGIVTKTGRKKTEVHTTEDKKEWIENKYLHKIDDEVWEHRIRRAIKEKQENR